MKNKTHYLKRNFYFLSVGVTHLIALLTPQWFQILLTPRMFPVWDFVVGIFDRKVLINMGWRETFNPQLLVSIYYAFANLKDRSDFTSHSLINILCNVDHNPKGLIYLYFLFFQSKKEAIKNENEKSEADWISIFYCVFHEMLCIYWL